MHHVAMRSELVQKEIKRLQLLEGSEVICEPWPYGKDGVNDDERLFQVRRFREFADLVLLLPCLSRSQEEASFIEPLRSSTRLLLHC